jgi:hypothetical protein
MTAAVVKFAKGHSGGQSTGTNPPPLYRQHDYCEECLGHHAIELTADMARHLRLIAPQTEAFWADEDPELIHGCRPLPRSVVKQNTLILTGEAVANLAESLETAYHALQACVRRLQQEHRPVLWTREVQLDADRAQDIMRVFFQYHLDEIDRHYGALASDDRDEH